MATSGNMAPMSFFRSETNVNKMLLGQMLKQTVIDLKVAVRALTAERDQLRMDVARLRTVTHCIL